MSAATTYPIRIDVVETSQVGEARRAAASLCTTLNFGEQICGQVAIIVTEMATNLALHAKSGEIILRPMQTAERLGIEVLSIDRGPGMSNLSRAMSDGFSTSGTSGNGLGAVSRIATVFDVFTAPPGSVMVSQMWAGGGSPAASLEVGTVSLPVKSETACGDSWYAEETGNGRTMILVADGLGHGMHAAEASRRAVNLFRENIHLDGVRLVELMHAGMRSTRGAAVAVAELREDLKELRFTGVGNIGGTIITNSESRGAVSQNGTVGAQVHRVRELIYPWASGSMLVMFSDGLTSQWQLQNYPGLRQRHPSVIAGVLYRDFPA